MRNMFRTLMVLTIALTAFAATSGAASANTLEDYRTAMKPFAVDMEAWADRLSELSEAAVSKPEIACSAEYAELARIGGWTVADLAGTEAPAGLADAHAALTASVAAMTEAARGACGDAAGAAEAIAAERAGFDTALLQIRVFTDNLFGPTVPVLTPDLPVSGN
jgi:hypothetical protein